jgi:DNA methylase.
LDKLTTWAIILDGKNDLERFEMLNIPLKVYDVWNFSECHNLMGKEYPGRIPGQLVANALHYYTKQGDLVADFMAGGGTTADVCLLMNRLCFCSDINPQRDFIVKHDLRDGLPALDNMRVKKA